MDASLLMMKELPVVLISYVLGCVVVGYYLVRWRIGQDVRSQGSGGVGASNVSRVLGRRGYALTLAGDALKGALATGMTIALDLDTWVVMLTIFAVVAGHIWPVQLRFRGGKGMGPLLGGMVIYDAPLVVIYFATTFVLYAFFRRVTASGLVAIALAPGAAFLLGHSGESFLGLVALAALVLFAHRDNIREIMSSMGNDTKESDSRIRT